MKIFTAWEIKLYLKYLKKYGLLDFQKCFVIRLAYDVKADLTVNEARKLLGAETDHPDSIRGAKFIWETEESQPEDHLIPQQVKDYYSDIVFEDGD